MAQIKYSALVSEVKGKLNGSVLQNGKTSAVLRNNLFVKKSSSQAQQLRRNQLASVAGMWRGLTYEERQSWMDGSVNNIETNSFGDKRKMAAYSLYCMLNINLKSIGSSMIYSYPEKPVFPDMILRSPSISFAGVSLTEFSIIADSPIVFNDWTFVFRGSLPLSSGIMSKRSSFVVTGIENLTTSSSIRTRIPNIDFPIMYTSGDKVRFELTAVHTIKGYSILLMDTFVFVS